VQLGDLNSSTQTAAVVGHMQQRPGDYSVTPTHSPYHRLSDLSTRR
jgi:hypothetical protein